MKSTILGRRYGDGDYSNAGILPLYLSVSFLLHNSGSKNGNYKNSVDSVFSTAYFPPICNITVGLVSPNDLDDSKHHRMMEYFV